MTNPVQIPDAAVQEELDTRLKAAGMYTIEEIMAGTPVDKWRVHSGMNNLQFFGEWLERKAREYKVMAAGYDLGDKDKSDELYEWVLAHSGAFHDVLVNFRAATLTNEGTKPVDVAAVREAEAVIEQNGEEVTAATMISVIADFLRENGKAVLLPENSFGKQILEFKLAADNLRALSAEPAQHPDDTAVDNFATRMKAKLAQKREEGRSGWQGMNADALTIILRQHVDKGDPIDVANLCMMLSENGQCIALAEPVQGKQWQDISTAEKKAFDVILRVPCKGSIKGYREVIGHYAEDLSGSEQPPFKGWFSDSGNGNGFREVHPNPTHWRRLPPAAPTLEAEA